MEESKDKVEKTVSPLTTESVKGVSRIGTSSVGGGDMSTMDEALGQIFVILKRMDKFDRLQNEKQLVDLQISQLEETDRNQKLIKALRGLPKRKRKLSPEEEKQRQQIKEEKSKPQPSEPSKTTGQAPTTQAPTKTTGQPATTQAPPKTTGQPATQQQAPATTTQAPPKTTGQPATTTTQPATTTQAPPKTTGQPATTTTQPATTTTQPATTTTQPATTTTQPATTTTTPVKPAPTQPAAPTTAPVKPGLPKPSTATKLGAGAGIVISALVAAGFSQKAQSNVLAQVKSESNFVPKSESLFYTTAKGIMGTFGEGRIPSEEFAQQFVSKKGDDRSEQLANHVYAKTDGNSAPGDGWKYRGRGFLQITGKSAYKSLGDYLKVDLVSNPDLLNTAEIAAKSIPWFFLNYKSYLTKGNPKSLEDISLVNRAVGFSDDKVGSKAKKRAELASEIQSMDSNSGSQIDQSSAANRDMKADANAQQPAPVNVNNTYENKKTSPSSGGGGGSDDTNPYERKKNQ